VDAALNATTAAFVQINGFGAINNFVIGDRNAGGTIVTSFSSPGSWQNFGSIFAAGVNANSVFTPAVPEPSTWALLLLGFAGLGFAFRQSRRKVSFA
jgi:hypothetical protein